MSGYQPDYLFGICLAPYLAPYLAICLVICLGAGLYGGRANSCFAMARGLCFFYLCGRWPCALGQRTLAGIWR